MTIINKAPPQPTILEASIGYTRVVYRVAPPFDEDVSNLYMKCNGSEDLKPANPETLLSVDGLVSNTTYLVELAAFDQFIAEDLVLAKSLVGTVNNIVNTLSTSVLTKQVPTITNIVNDSQTNLLNNTEITISGQYDSLSVQYRMQGEVAWTPVVAFALSNDTASLSLPLGVVEVKLVSRAYLADGTFEDVDSPIVTIEILYASGLDSVETAIEDISFELPDINELLETVSQDIIETITRNEENTAFIRRVDAITTDIEGTTQAISILEGQVNDPINNTSALYQTVQSAQTDIAGNAESITGILSGVTGETDSATALLRLDAWLQDGGLGARAFLGTDVNGRVTGIVVNDSGSLQQIELQAGTFAFLDPEGTPMVYFDTLNANYVFRGSIQALGGWFAGELQAATGTFNGSLVVTPSGLGYDIARINESEVFFGSPVGSYFSYDLNTGTATLKGRLILEDGYSVTSVEDIQAQDGAPGTPGSGFYSKTIPTTKPSVTTAYLTDYFNNADVANRNPVTNDVFFVTWTNASDAYQFNGSNWVAASLVVNGNIIAEGSIVGSKVIAGTITANELAAGAVTAEKLNISTTSADGLVDITIDPTSSSPIDIRHATTGEVAFSVQLIDGSPKAIVNGQAGVGFITKSTSITPDVKKSINQYYQGEGNSAAGTDTSLTSGDTDVVTINTGETGRVNIAWVLSDSAAAQGDSVSCYVAPQWRIRVYRGTTSGVLISDKTYTGTATCVNTPSYKPPYTWTSYTIDIDDGVTDETTKNINQTYTILATKVSGSGSALSNMFSASTPAFTINELNNVGSSTFGSGHWRDKDTGFTVQWGFATVSANSTSSVTFDVPFTNIFQCVANGDVSDNNYVENLGLQSFSNTSVTLRNWTPLAEQVRFIAIGLS